MHITVNGKGYDIESDASVAAALLHLGIHSFRTSVTNSPRGPLCGMGICFECRVTIDGIRHVRSCMIMCREGMAIETDEHD